MAMQESNLAAAEHALFMYRDRVRQCLSQFSGYECQVTEGEFMMAFSEPTQAVLFCLTVRRECDQSLPYLQIIITCWIVIL